MNYTLTATLGPSSKTPDIWQAMLAAGTTGFRLNTSHLTLSDLDAWLERIDAFQTAWATPFPFVLDLQGSKWRIGTISSLTLQAGQNVRLVYGDRSSAPEDLPIPHRDFFDAAGHSSGEIVLNDAKIRLRMVRSTLDSLEAVVELGGELSSHKGITYTASEYRTEALSEKDQSIISRTRDRSDVRYAISYIRDGQEMFRYRSMIGTDAYLIAKIERAPAVGDVLRIANYSNELWLCRGDLGAELGLSGMARAAHKFARLIPSLPVPVVLAGQVLEHMTAHSTPTRAEICNLYDALQSGYTGIVLSDETAVGANPVEACRAAAIFMNDKD